MDLAFHRWYWLLHYDAGGAIFKGILVCDGPAVSRFRDARTRLTRQHSTTCRETDFNHDTSNSEVPHDSLVQFEPTGDSPSRPP
jgi:hypothetical protein